MKTFIIRTDEKVIAKLLLPNAPVNDIVENGKVVGVSVEAVDAMDALHLLGQMYLA